jgi:hypothetical protein
LGDTPAFVLYSFADIKDTKTAQEAVKADAYCLQLVPEKLLTKDLCKTALQSPNADGFIKGTSKNSLFVSYFFQVIFFENFIANIHHSIFVCNLMLFLYLIDIHVFNNFTCSRQDTLIP